MLVHKSSYSSEKINKSMLIYKNLNQQSKIKFFSCFDIHSKAMSLEDFQYSSLDIKVL